MKDSLPTRLYRREIQSSYVQSPKLRSIYGDRQWIRNLDVVNELDGHSGCVNALSWSKSGRLLASGSDDQHLNIHAYQPDDLGSQFSLTTTVATGHRANIFSVKFMPHSNDRTVITAAGDSEVRIFDLEYAGNPTGPSAAAHLATQGRRRGRNSIYDGVRYLSDGDTNCRVYQSHGDRVKRIVTESSPHLFLTCSEDGEVRQWDIRQPSSAYPPPQGGRMSGEDTSVPPALISYKRYMLDLNTISCSASQPHYIALGGAHLHCFLHDRRMLGRDRLRERGISPSAASSMTDAEEELMSQATQCVKKFAPGGQPRMRRTDNGHITACKISDANPNEMIVSWSGEHIYSFDLLRSPDAREESASAQTTAQKSSAQRVRQSSERKRKRNGDSQVSLAHEGTDRASSRPRTEALGQAQDQTEMALRIQYQNGQIEDIPIDGSVEQQGPASTASRSAISDRAQLASRIAETTVKIRQDMFTLGTKHEPTVTDPSGHSTSFTSVLGYCASVFPNMKQISSSWRYAVNSPPLEVSLQRTLRAHRDSAMRFVQASGVIARALGGHLRTAEANLPLLDLFQRIHFMPGQGPDLPQNEQFSYDFLKAIILWTESGIGALLEGFTKSARTPRTSSRSPVPPNAGEEGIEEALIPYLLSIATTRPVINVDASRFEIDERRVLYNTERDAVLAFAAAVKTPFADLSSPLKADGTAQTHAEPLEEQAQDRRTALQHWAFGVGRGLLMTAGQGIDFALVDRAFGGLGRPETRTVRAEAAQRQQYEPIDPDEEELVVSTAELVESQRSNTVQREQQRSSPPPDSDEDDLIPLSDVRVMLEDMQEDEDENEDDDDDDEGSQGYHTRNIDADADADSDGNDEESQEDEDGDDDGEDDYAGYGLPSHMSRSAFDRRKLREKVEGHVPCAPHTRVYRGHCNVKTVKDVNYFGLDDEYVISGSDDGNFFIWDRKTAQLVNILEGDGEVVNVLQGHPYEPTLAVSGIDHTIKIFSPDARAREAARLGRGVEAADATAFSSIAWPSRIRGRRATRQSDSSSEPAMPAGRNEARPEDDDEYVAPNGLSSRKRMHQEYQITSRNDSERQGGNQDAFITRSMLAQLAQSIRRHRGVDGDGDDDEGRRIILGDDCTVM